MQRKIKDLDKELQWVKEESREKSHLNHQADITFKNANTLQDEIIKKLEETMMKCLCLESDINYLRGDIGHLNEEKRNLTLEIIKSKRSGQRLIYEKVQGFKKEIYDK